MQKDNITVQVQEIATGVFSQIDILQIMIAINLGLFDKVNNIIKIDDVPYYMLKDAEIDLSMMAVVQVKDILTPESGALSDPPENIYWKYITQTGYMFNGIEISPSLIVWDPVAAAYKAEEPEESVMYSKEDDKTYVYHKASVEDNENYWMFLEVGTGGNFKRYNT